MLHPEVHAPQERAHFFRAPLLWHLFFLTFLEHLLAGFLSKHAEGTAPTLQELEAAFRREPDDVWAAAAPDALLQ